MRVVRMPPVAGVHELAAEVKVTEPFGWGLAVTLRVDNEGVVIFPND